MNDTTYLLVTDLICLIPAMAVGIYFIKKSIFNPNIVLPVLIGLAIWGSAIALMLSFSHMDQNKMLQMEKPVVIEKRVTFYDKNTGLSLDKPR